MSKEDKEKSTMLRGSKNVYLRHIKILERDIDASVRLFRNENDFSLIKLKSLKLAYINKNVKIKKLDDKMLDIVPQGEIKKEIELNLRREQITFQMLAKINHCMPKKSKKQFKTGNFNI